MSKFAKMEAKRFVFETCGHPQNIAAMTDQGLAECMAMGMFVHECCLAEAERRGLTEICGMLPSGAPYINYPAWPEGITCPETIVTRFYDLAKAKAH